MKLSIYWVGQQILSYLQSCRMIMIYLSIHFMNSNRYHFYLFFFRNEANPEGAKKPIAEGQRVRGSVGLRQLDTRRPPSPGQSPLQRPVPLSLRDDDHGILRHQRHGGLLAQVPRDAVQHQRQGRRHVRR